MKKVVLLLTLVVSFLVTLPHAIAQESDGLPFRVNPDTETVELHLGAPEMQDCVKLEFSIGVGKHAVPYEFDVIIQGSGEYADARWAFNVSTLLPEKAAGKFIAVIPVDQFQLKDPANGNLDPTKLFDPKKVTASDWGLYFWDDNKAMKVTVSSLDMTPCAVAVAS